MSKESSAKLRLLALNEWQSGAREANDDGPGGEDCKSTQICPCCALPVPLKERLEEWCRGHTDEEQRERYATPGHGVSIPFMKAVAS